MISLSFRAKLLLAMMLLVVGVTTTTLLITENQVRVSYERHFRQSFRFQMESFLQQREARLAPVEERVAEAASSPRLIAAMDNAQHAGADPQDGLVQGWSSRRPECSAVYGAKLGSNESPSREKWANVHSRGTAQGLIAQRKAQ